jgi:hypothetical protein
MKVSFSKIRFLFVAWIALVAVAAAPAVAATTAAATTVAVATVAESPLEGRWCITIDMDGIKLPSWLEVKHSGYKTLVGQFVGTSGSARPIAQVFVEGNSFNFSIPPQWEKGTNDVKVTGVLSNDKISGLLTSPEGKTYSWTGERAPSLKRTKAPVWDKPIALIKNNSLDGWRASGTNQWTVKDGVLSSAKSGANLITTDKFEDFKLHVEFRVPKGSNSGVYLRGRYEVQITDSYGKEPAFDQLGAIYGFIVPIEMASKPAGEWQTLDVTLIGRLVTVVLNGKTIVHTQEVPGITGGALDSQEAAPGPLMIQGDHGPIDYRNIVITPAKK